ncbi:IS701 family transposase [Streptomyces sp. MUM 2J]|uniref:IS701 family transposase n=1 Tax=Streptomyces sp. MUM 2J TaxID=2791987 RepID=UPI0023D8F87E|nr:IS701 family transposase [Streptomyces sp. MUM 2J]
MAGRRAHWPTIPAAARCGRSSGPWDTARSRPVGGRYARRPTRSRPRGPCPEAAPDDHADRGVLAAYATTLGRALVGRELYLPKSWTEDRERCRTARVPDEREFATKGELARRTVLRALASPPPIAWVTADSAYGQDNRFRRLLEQSGVGYVLAVPKSQFSVRCSRIEGLFAQAPDEAWEKISCGDGAKGPRVYHWAAVRLPAVAEFDYQGEAPHRMRWALARRSISKPDEIAYHLAYAPLHVTVQELVRVDGTRWAIEECFQVAKNECGLDQYEVRRYVGWYRHITLAMLAHAFLAATAHQAGERGAEQVKRPGPSDSQWRRFGDSWQLVFPGPRT